MGGVLYEEEEDTYQTTWRRRYLSYTVQFNSNSIVCYVNGGFLLSKE